MSDQDDYLERMREEVARAVHEKYCIENQGKSTIGIAIDAVFDMYDDGTIDRSQLQQTISSMLDLEVVVGKHGPQNKQPSVPTPRTRETYERVKPGEKVPSVADLERMLSGEINEQNQQ